MGEPFSCVLPDHGDRAVLYPTTGGYWRYRCGSWTAGLAEVRASLGYGRARRVGPHDDALGKTEVARWGERLDHEAGLLSPRVIDHELPLDASPAALAVAGGVVLLLALRDERWGAQPFTFTKWFAVAWCGVSEYTARLGLDELRALGWLVREGMQGRAFLYTHPDPAEVIPLHPQRLQTGEEFWDALVAAFPDAEEIKA